LHPSSGARREERDKEREKEGEKEREREREGESRERVPAVAKPGWWREERGPRKRPQESGGISGRTGEGHPRWRGCEAETAFQGRKRDGKKKGGRRCKTRTSGGM